MLEIFSLICKGKISSLQFRNKSSYSSILRKSVFKKVAERSWLTYNIFSNLGLEFHKADSTTLAGLKLNNHKPSNFFPYCETNNDNVSKYSKPYPRLQAQCRILCNVGSFFCIQD